MPTENKPLKDSRKSSSTEEEKLFEQETDIDAQLENQRNQKHLEKDAHQKGRCYDENEKPRFENDDNAL